MAISNKVWREGEFVPQASEPGLTVGFAWRDAVEVQAVKQIAGQRFPLPSVGEPNLQTYINLPDRSLGIRAEGGSMVFPDIVVIDSPTTEVNMIAEVETVRSLGDGADVVEKWRTFCSLGPLYLFVPLAHLDKARALLRENKVRLAGLRTWRHMAGMDFTDIVDIRF
jgi:hypothetical protein